MARLDPVKNDNVTANLLLSVALFMGLMCFFIVLNAFSSTNTEKMAMARQSLDLSFGFIGQGAASFENGGDNDGAVDTMEVATSAALRSVLPDLGFSSYEGASGQIMQVDIPMDAWQKRFRALHLRLADLMVHENPNGRFMLNIMALNGEAGTRVVVGAAGRLEREGVNARDLSVSYADMGRDVVRLQFIERRGGR